MSKHIGAVAIHFASVAASIALLLTDAIPLLRQLPINRTAALSHAVQAAYLIFLALPTVERLLQAILILPAKKHDADSCNN